MPLTLIPEHGQILPENFDNLKMSDCGKTRIYFVGLRVHYSGYVVPLFEHDRIDLYLHESLSFQGENIAMDEINPYATTADMRRERENFHPMGSNSDPPVRLL